MNHNLEEKARDLLMRFINEMNKWESWAYQLYRSENGGPEKNRDKAKIELEKIYDVYLTKKTRKTGRLAGPDVASIPEYDSEDEQIESCELFEEKKIILYTKKQDHNIRDYFENYRYTILYSNGRLLIDKREILFHSEGKWKNIVF